jgi:hypothetical protein
MLPTDTALTRDRPRHAAFWEPGGERLHLQAGNHLPDRWTRFVAVMVGVPGEPMMVPV